MLATREQVPNVLSLSRIPLSMLFVAFYSDTNVLQYWLGVCVCFTALITDFLDGYLARKWRVSSLSGYLLDGLGDKSFTVAFCIVVSQKYPEISILSWFLVFREVVLYGLRTIDTDLEKNLKFLRGYSLAQAACIRLFFLTVLIDGYTRLHISKSIPWEALLSIGVLSAIFGYITIYFLVKELAKKAV